MNKNSGKRIKMSLYTVGTLFRKGRKKMSGEQLVAITPYNNNYDWNYSKKSGIYNLIDEQRNLPKAVVSELIEKIQWFPVGDWKYIGNRILSDKVKEENFYEN